MSAALKQYNVGVSVGSKLESRKPADRHDLGTCRRESTLSNVTYESRFKLKLTKFTCTRTVID